MAEEKEKDRMDAEYRIRGFEEEVKDVASRLVALVGSPRDDAVLNSIRDTLDGVNTPRASSKDKEIGEIIDRLFDSSPRGDSVKAVKQQFEQMLANPAGGRKSRKSRKSKKTRKTRTRKTRKYSRRR